MARFDKNFLRRTRRDPLVASVRSPAYQAYQILHWGLVAIPVVTGVDKFAGGVLTDWDHYLAPVVAQHLPFSIPMFMVALGVVEIAVGLIILAKPRVGAYAVAGWFFAIIANHLLRGGRVDIALRDLGLGFAALALARLSIDFDTKSITRQSITTQT